MVASRCWRSPSTPTSWGSNITPSSFLAQRHRTRSIWVSSRPRSSARRCRPMPPPRRLARELRALDGAGVRIGGHLQDFRNLGGVAFALVRDGSGVAQVTLKKGETDPKLFDLLGELPRESVVEIEGIGRLSEKANRGAE